MMKLVFTFTLAYVLFVGPIRADHQDLSINLSETVILSSRN